MKVQFLAMKVMIITILIIGLMPILEGQIRVKADGGTYPVPTPNSPANNYFLGAYYMPKSSSVNHLWDYLTYYNRDPQVTTSHRTRKPLLGYYSGDDSEAMDWQIYWMVNHGLSYLIFNDYWADYQQSPTYANSINSFLNAHYRNYMKFGVSLTTINVLNQDPTKIYNMLYYIAPYYRDHYFNLPNYLYIDNKPVIFIHHSSVIGCDAASDPVVCTQNYMTAFEHAVFPNWQSMPNQHLYWVYGFADLNDASFPSGSAGLSYYQKYKSMGYSAIYPYADGNVCHILNQYPDQCKATVAGPPQSVDYQTYVQSSNVETQDALSNAGSAQLGFIPSIQPNEDNRTLQYGPNPANPKTNATFIFYTNNPSQSLYANLLARHKYIIDNTPQNNLVAIDNKPMIGVGHVNEWVDDSDIEPGTTLLNYNSGTQSNDPFMILKTISNVFLPSGVAADAQPTKDYTPIIPRQDTWNFGNPNDVKQWYLVLRQEKMFGYRRRSLTRASLTPKRQLTVAF